MAEASAVPDATRTGGKPAHGSAHGVDQAGHACKLVCLVDDAHDVTLAPAQGGTGNNDDGGLSVIEGLQVAPKATGGHG